MRLQLLCEALSSKFKLREACCLLLPAVITIGLSAEVSPAASDLPANQQVIAFLTESIDWYRHRAIERQIATEPVDLVFLEDNRPVAAQIVQLSFDFARADASAAATAAGGNQKESTAIAIGPSPDLVQFVQLENKAALGGRQASEEIEAIKKKLQTASGAERRKLQAALDAAQSRLDVLQAGSATLRQLVEFMRAFTGRESGDLTSSIDDLARTVPAVSSPTALVSKRKTRPLLCLLNLAILESSLSAQRYQRWGKNSAYWMTIFFEPTSCGNLAMISALRCLLPWSNVFRSALATIFKRTTSANCNSKKLDSMSLRPWSRYSLRRSWPWISKVYCSQHIHRTCRLGAPR